MDFRGRTERNPDLVGLIFKPTMMDDEEWNASCKKGWVMGWWMEMKYFEKTAIYIYTCRYIDMEKKQHFWITPQLSQKTRLWYVLVDLCSQYHNEFRDGHYPFVSKSQVVQNSGADPKKVAAIIVHWKRVVLNHPLVDLWSIRLNYVVFPGSCLRSKSFPCRGHTEKSMGNRWWENWFRTVATAHAQCLDLYQCWILYIYLI